MKLGERISAWLKARGLTQAQLAEKLDIADSTVSMWITGKSSPLQSNRDALYGVLGVTEAQFYGRVPAPRKVAA